MASVAPRGVGVWGSPLHNNARAEWHAPVPPSEYNRNRLQGTNRNHVPTGSPPAGRRAPSAVLPTGTPVARASWSAPVPPERYNVRRLVGANAKRVPDSHPRTATTVAALMQGEAPAGLMSKMGPLPKMANVAEVMAGLKAALDTSADDKERAHIGDMIETLRPIAVIAARRALTPDEQAIVDGVAQQLLGEAQEEVAAQAGEEQAHQAARAAEFSEIEEATKAKGAATDMARGSRQRADAEAEAADQIAREMDAIEENRDRAGRAAAKVATALDRNAAKVRDQLEKLARAADSARAGAEAADAESRRAAARAEVLRGEAERQARTAADRAQAAEHERRLGWDDVGARALAADAERLATESARRSAEAAEQNKQAVALAKEAKRAAREAKRHGEAARAADAEGDRLAVARRQVDAEFNRGEELAAREMTAAGEARAAKLLEAAAADAEAKEIEAQAEAVPAPGKPRLPEKSQRTRRRARAAAAREEEEARAVDIISQGVRGGVLRAAPGQAAEAGEERKEPPSAAAVPGIPEGLDLGGYSRADMSRLLEALHVRGHSSVLKGGSVEDGVAKGLRLLQAAEEEGGRGAPRPGTLARVLENIRTGADALGLGLKFPPPRARR